MFIFNAVPIYHNKFNHDYRHDDQTRTKQVLILLQGEYFGSDGVLFDNLDLDAVARIDVSLSHDYEDILNDGYHFFHRQRLLLVEPVLMPDLTCEHEIYYIAGRSRAQKKQ
jgi:hypothetical protein